MKAWLVTSAVTFVPNNYDDFVLSMADCPQVAGLIVVDNRSWDIVLKSLLLVISGAAPGMGLQLLKNQFGKSLQSKKEQFQLQGKDVHVVSDLNSQQSLELIKSLQPDLLLNARTRSFFKKSLLAIPKIGCINIHHGLLPNQRGLMCDFWAHLLDTPAGFSIHQMTSKLDDGAILKVVEVPRSKNSYLDSIKRGSSAEAATAKEILLQLAEHKCIQGQENLKTENTVYRTNPTLKDLYKLRFKGIKI